MQGIVTNWLQTGMMRLSTRAIMPSTNPALPNSVPLTRPMHRRRGHSPATVGSSYHVTCRGSKRNGGLCGMIGIRSVELRGRNPSQQVVGLSVSILSPSMSQA